MPDLKALGVKIEELEKWMEQRFQAVDHRFDDERNYLEKRFDSLEPILNQQQVINNLVERVRLLETSVRATRAAHGKSKIERADTISVRIALPLSPKSASNPALAAANSRHR